MLLERLAPLAWERPQVPAPSRAAVVVVRLTARRRESHRGTGSDHPRRIATSRIAKQSTAPAAVVAAGENCIM